MIPPEPDPPEPTTPVLTYETATEFTMGSDFPAVYYKSIQYRGIPCEVDYLSSGLVTQSCTDLVMYTDALGDTRFYVALGTASNFFGLLDDNFELHTTCNVYTVENGQVTFTAQREVQGCIPSDYVSILRSLDFELQRRV